MLNEELYYELGVFMFNAYNPNYTGLVFDTYCIASNFEQITKMIGVKEYAKLRKGYLSEAYRYHINKEKADEMFEDEMEYLDHINL